MGGTVATVPDVLLDIEAGIARLTLNRPDAANGIGQSLADALLAAAEEVRDRADVRAVLLTGAGARFCGGGDVRSFAAAEDPGELIASITAPLHAAIAILTTLDAPIVAAVQGSAAGAGIGLVAASDLVVAGASTKFVLAYTGIGLTPDGSTSWFLPRLIGYRRAVELMLTNRALSAAEAFAAGLITEVVDDERLTERAEELVTRVASGPTKAYGTVKRLVAASATNDLVTQMALEADGIAAAARTTDGREGVAAFVAKRSPGFSGS